MKKHLLILLVSLSVWQTKAQKTITTPSTKDFVNYLYGRQHGIEAKLYKAAIEGRIKAYLTDSLAATYPLSELKQRGSQENFVKAEDNVNATQVIEPFHPKDIKGLIFLQQTDHNPFEFSEKNELKGMALLFQPIIGGVLANRMPLFWIHPQDLKSTLTAEELTFVSLLYFYNRHSNYFFDSYWEPGAAYDPFWHLNVYGQSTTMTDSTFYMRVGDMLRYSQFNMEDILYYGSANRSKAMIFDEQQKKYISLNEFDNLYTEKAMVQNDPNSEPELMSFGIRMENISSVSFDNAGKLSKYHYALELNKKTINFYIDASVNNQEISTRPIIWFFEDYLRWSEALKEVKGKK